MNDQKTRQQTVSLTTDTNQDKIEEYLIGDARLLSDSARALLADQTWDNLALIKKDGSSSWDTISSIMQVDCFLYAIAKYRPEKIRDAMAIVRKHCKNLAKLYAESIAVGNWDRIVCRHTTELLLSDPELSAEVLAKINNYMKFREPSAYLDITKDEYQLAVEAKNIPFIMITLKIMQHDRTKVPVVRDPNHCFLRDCSVENKNRHMAELKNNIREATLCLVKQGVDVSAIEQQLRSDEGAILSPGVKTMLHKFSPSACLGFEGKLAQEIARVSAEYKTEPYSKKEDYLRSVRPNI